MSSYSESNRRTDPWEREAFSYDPEADILYQQYREQYQKLGRQAMEDTLGQAAGLTGGYGSSYGETAGQQTYDTYLGKLNDLLPELYDRKREEYDAQTEAYYRSLSAEEQQKNDAFDRCMKLIGSGIRPSQDELLAAGLTAEQMAAVFAVSQYQAGGQGTGSGSGSTAVTAAPVTLPAEQIRELQQFLGVTVDGSYGPQTQAAAEAYFGTAGMSAAQAWVAYQRAIGAASGGNGGSGGSTDHPQ